MTNVTLQSPWWNERTRMEKVGSVFSMFLVFISVILGVVLVLVVMREDLMVSQPFTYLRGDSMHILLKQYKIDFLW